MHNVGPSFQEVVVVLDDFLKLNQVPTNHESLHSPPINSGIRAFPEQVLPRGIAERPGGQGPALPSVQGLQTDFQKPITDIMRLYLISCYSIHQPEPACMLLEPKYMCGG